MISWVVLLGDQDVMTSKKLDKYGSWKEGDKQKEESPSVRKQHSIKEAIKAIQVNKLYNRNRKRKMVNHKL